VIELVGNGKSSRALIQKGLLNYHLKTEIDGFIYNVVDEKNNAVTGASVSKLNYLLILPFLLFKLDMVRRTLVHS
jgi:hypothetical protein